MTRVVVQRGSGASNSSQKRDSTVAASSSSSSSASLVPVPPTPSSAPESSAAAGQVGVVSSSGEEEAEAVGKENEYYCHGEFRNLPTDTDARFSVCSVEGKLRERDEGAVKGKGPETSCEEQLNEGLDRRRDSDLVARMNVCRISAEAKREELERGGAGEGGEGRKGIDDDEAEGSLWSSEGSAYEQKPGSEHVVERVGGISVPSPPQSQHCIQIGMRTSTASFHHNAMLNSSPPRVLGSESLAHGTASGSHFTPSLPFSCADPMGGGGAGLDKDDIDSGRVNCSQNMTELVGCSYVSAPASPLLLSSCASKSTSNSRRGGWMGPVGPGGVRAIGPPRRLPRIMKSAKISPNSSRPSSPRSYGECDGYNSADEQSAWGPGPSGYEDDSERERQFEVDLRRYKNLEVKRMAEDGNCLFRSVADQVYGDTEMYDETRQMCIDYMEKERDHFSSFVTESFTAYCKRKRRDKVYGNNLEIQAMAEMYNRPIHIYSYSTEPINIFHGSYETDLPPMRLSYHRSNHYNSLVDPSKPAVGAGLGFGSLRGRNVDREQVKAAIKAQQEQQIDKALIAEGRFYSDLELTEQEIERMVMEASRAEFLAEESHRQQFPWNEETSTSASAMPSSSRTAVGSGVEVVDPFQTLQHTSRAVSPSATSTTGSGVQLSKNVRMLLSMGFSYLRVMEAHSIFGDDVNNMLCYLLETEAGSLGDVDNMYRMKGKAAEG